MHAFRTAVEAGDIDAAIALLADDVVFTSPVAFSPYAGKALTGAILRNVFEVFEGFRYVNELENADGDHALVFEATVAGRALTGCDFVHVGADGLIDSFMVMVRPLSAANALAEAMGARFGRIQEQALAG